MASIDEVRDFLLTDFPQCKSTIVSLGDGAATVKQQIGDADLRPGGTVSGPTMMAIADFAVYAAILGEIGIVALAVTTNLSINFLRKPNANKDMLGVCRLIKTGKRLIVAEVNIYSEGDELPVAHVIATYSIPTGS